MEQILLKKQNGREIPCIAEFPDEMSHVVIVIHGYESSKESDNAANLMRRLPPEGFGVITYDQPGHGTQQAAEEELTITSCLASLACVEEYVVRRFGCCDAQDPCDARPPELCYFGSSFGAYILGLYLAGVSSIRNGTPAPLGRKAFMRCAAVNFPELARDVGEYTSDMDDLFEIYDRGKPEDVRFAFAHGACDSTVPVGAVIEFTERFGYPLTVFPGEEHPICTDPESPAKVAGLAMALYRQER